jgi:hypothetical protein
MLDSSQAPGSEGSLHERAMLARPLHCHCDAESTDRAPSMASQIDFDRNAEQLPIELASVVGTAARLHMLSASSQVTSRSWVGRPTCRQTASPTSKSNGDISAREWLHAQHPSVLRAPGRVRASLSCSQPKAPGRRTHFDNASSKWLCHCVRYISLRVQDAGRSIATRCIAMLYRATRPRELPSSVNALMSACAA